LPERLSAQPTERCCRRRDDARKNFMPPAGGHNQEWVSNVAAKATEAAARA
jgi:hypothetical protein